MTPKPRKGKELPIGIKSEFSAFDSMIRVTQKHTGGACNPDSEHVEVGGNPSPQSAECSAVICRDTYRQPFLLV